MQNLIFDCMLVNDIGPRFSAGVRARDLLTSERFADNGTSTRPKIHQYSRELAVS